MKNEQVENAREWLRQYISGFYTKGADAFLDSHIRLKEEHTDRVCEQMRVLTDALGLSREDANLAQAAALLHDVGRFEQIQTYRTYVDPKSVNHCTLGVEVLEREGILEELDAEEKAILKAAVEHHGAKLLSEGLDERTALFCKLIRDADKLDVLPLLIENFKRYYADPENFDLEVEFPDEPRVSAHVVEAILNHTLIGYEQIETLHDAQLVLLGWVYDINFIPALQRIWDCHYLEAVIEFLPDIAPVHKVTRQITEYVKRRLEQSQ